MRVKNVSGSTQYFRFGKRGLTIADNEVALVGVTDRYDNSAVEEKVFQDALKYEAQGLLEILDGPNVVSQTGVASSPAYGSVTFSGVAANEDTVTVGETVYEFVTSGSAEAGNVTVLRGSSAAESAENFAAAVNARSISDGVTAQHVDLGAEIVVLYTTLKGTAANALGIVLEKDGSNIAVSGATLDGGTDGNTFPGSVFTKTSAGTSLTFHTGLPSISAISLTVVASNGSLKNITSAVLVDGGSLNLDGGTLSEDDVVTLVVHSI